MASDNPDQLMKSEVIINGYDPCDEAGFDFEDNSTVSVRRKRNAAPTCEAGQVRT